ncbi:hypothetical protein AAC387_Pa05g1541 [Persea americana]
MHVDLSSLEAKREKKQKLAALYPLPTRGYTSHRYVREHEKASHKITLLFVVFPDPCDFAYSCEMTACLGDE